MSLAVLSWFCYWTIPSQRRRLPSSLLYSQRPQQRRISLVTLWMGAPKSVTKVNEFKGTVCYKMTVNYVSAVKKRKKYFWLYFKNCPVPFKMNWQHCQRTWPIVCTVSIQDILNKHLKGCHVYHRPLSKTVNKQVNVAAVLTKRFRE